METIDLLANELVPHYSHFDVGNRLLFTGHSHQAWPDVALEGLQEAFAIAAADVDSKWEKAFEKTEILREYLRSFYEDPEGLYCRGESTHQLMVSWLSSFNLAEKPKIITTDREFHSMYRQLNRLQEEGLQVMQLDPSSDMLSQLSREADHHTAAIMLSRVYFGSGLINQDLKEIAELADSKDIPLLIDDYHGTNAVPLSLTEEGLLNCYLLTGGYKYLEWGEGNCFLRFPPKCRLRPAVTGWFAAFDSLDKQRNSDPTRYDRGNQRFASGTYDPTSQFRAAKVAVFFREQQLTPSRLRTQYLSQVKQLKQLFLKKDLDPSVIKLKHHQPLEQNGGFLALQSPFAQDIREKLLARKVFTDARGDVLRLGPAPYITSQQIEQAMGELGNVVEEIST